MEEKPVVVGEIFILSNNRTSERLTKKDVGDKGYKFCVENFLDNVYVGYR